MVGDGLGRPEREGKLISVSTIKKNTLEEI
jgi:hypothetical protein